MVGHAPLCLSLSSPVNVPLVGRELHVHNKVCVICGCVCILLYPIPLYLIVFFDYQLLPSVLMLCTDDDKFYMFYNHGITSANCIDKHFLSTMYLKCICINLYDIFCSRLPNKVVYMTSKFGLKGHVIHYREEGLQNGK